MSWRNTIIFAVIMGIYTALMAMYVPDGNSFHDIAVTPEWWVLPAIIVIVNCKKPLEAALKTFVFFLISQPLVYLVQVPFNSMGWGLFGYYRYWFYVTLLTLPGGFIGWFIKKDEWYSGIILSVMTGLLTAIGISFILNYMDNPPNHLITIIYCFSIIPVFIFAIFKKKIPRIICAVITVVVALAYGIVSFGRGGAPYEAYNNQITTENNITFVGEPYISAWSSEGGEGNVEIIKYDEGYTFKITGVGETKYYFEVSDDVNEYHFEYYFDKNENMVKVNRI